MKRMMTAVAALLLSAATFAQADQAAPAGQPNPRMAQGQRKPLTPEERAKRETDQINSLVPLGDKYDKVLAVNTDFITKRMAMKNDMKDQPKEQQDAQRADMQAKMKDLQQAHKKGLEEAMGKELFDKYQAAQKAQREERRQQRSQQNGGAPAAAPAGK
ncbi:MAG: hypothetical protein JST76_11325 [Bacteroidetes bacterium]|nr:hypothetical protein [Bacteroidota bacterium]